MLPEYLWQVGPQTYTLRLTLRQEARLQQTLGYGLEQLGMRLSYGNYGVTEMLATLSAGLRGGWKPDATNDQLLEIYAKAVGEPPKAELNCDGAMYPLVLPLTNQLEVEKQLGYGLEQLVLRISAVNYGLQEMLVVLGAGLRQGSPKIRSHDDVLEVLELAGRNHFRHVFRTFVAAISTSNQPLTEAFHAFIRLAMDTAQAASNEVAERLPKPSAEEKKETMPDPLSNAPSTGVA